MKKLFIILGALCLCLVSTYSHGEQKSEKYAIGLELADNSSGQNAQNIFEFTFPFAVKYDGGSKSLVRPKSGGVFKLVLDLSANDKIKASFVEQNGLKITPMLSFDKGLNDARLEWLTTGELDGLELEADEDEDNYKLAIFSKSKGIGYGFELENSKLIEGNYEQPGIVSKRLSHFIVKMNSKFNAPVNIQTSQSSEGPVYYYDYDDDKISLISCTRTKVNGCTIMIIFNDSFEMEGESGLKNVTFHSRGNQFTGLLHVVNESDTKFIFIIEKEKDVMNWLCNNDVYEIAINGITNDAFFSAESIKTLIERLNKAIQ